MLRRVRVNPPSFATRAALILLALCSIAHASEHTRLVVTRQQSAAECPDEQALRDAVGARLGYEPFAADASSLVVVAFRREGATLRATVQLQDAAGVVQGERTLSSAHGDCDELAATTALTISILLDPRSAGAPPGPPLPERKTEPMAEPRAEPEAPQQPAPKPPPAEPSPPPTLRKERPVASSFSLLPIALGPIQAFSSGGHAFGLRLGLSAQLDLDPHWALRLPLVLALATRSSHADYAELDLIPGVVYRFRKHASDAFTLRHPQHQRQLRRRRPLHRSCLPRHHQRLPRPPCRCRRGLRSRSPRPRHCQPPGHQRSVRYRPYSRLPRCQWNSRTQPTQPRRRGRPKASV
jgi:hypothetical protein